MFTFVCDKMILVLQWICKGRFDQEFLTSSTFCRILVRMCVKLQLMSCVDWQHKVMLLFTFVCGELILVLQRICEGRFDQEFLASSSFCSILIGMCVELQLMACVDWERKVSLLFIFVCGKLILVLQQNSKGRFDQGFLAT